MKKTGIVQGTNVKTNNYSYPFAKEFEDYLRNVKCLSPRNIDNITSRINSLLVNGYKSRNSNTAISFTNNFTNCLKYLPDIIKGPKKYHNLAVQVLAAIFAILDDAIQNNPKMGALHDIRSAFIHYYVFIEQQLSQSKGTRLKIAPGILSNIQSELINFYGLHNSTLCFTQAEVRDNFIQRLHTQDRLSNHNLLFPISLIEKLIGRNALVNNWTNDAIDNIEILVSPDKKKNIKFKDISFILFETSCVSIFDRTNCKKYTVYSRKYRIVEESRAVQMVLQDPGQPLQTFAIDHKISMSSLIDYHFNQKNVNDLQNLSNDFCADILNHGQQYLKNNDWMKKHPYAKGLDILNRKTIKDLSTGYKNNPSRMTVVLPNITDDIKRLHISNNPSKDGLELMDSVQNRIKGDS
jgi:hypothetical protein